MAICVRDNIEFEIINGWKKICESFDTIGVRLINTTEKINNREDSGSI